MTATSRVNHKFLDIFGGSSALHWADSHERDEMIRILNRDGRVTNYECRISDTRGNVHSRLTALRLDHDRNILEGSIVDVSERKQLEAEKIELERRSASAKKLEGLGILAGGVAHNFNNLLAVMLGNAEILRDTLPAESDCAFFVKEIFKAGYRSRDLIDKLLLMGRKRVLDLRRMGLNDVLRDGGAALRKELRSNIAIDFCLSTSPCPVKADVERIKEILLNLALNAQDAIPGEGRLTIATKEVLLEVPMARRQGDCIPGPFIQLTVSDTGEGMDQETMTKIFDPFFTTKEPGKGTGLGLSTVYGIVQQHSGSIEVESQPERGTQFRIYLPRVLTAG
jgi:signal transduction histidine kinase